MLFLLSTIMKENKNRLKDKYLDVMKKDNQKNKKNIKWFSWIKVKNIGKLNFFMWYIVLFSIIKNINDTNFSIKYKNSWFLYKI